MEESRRKFCSTAIFKALIAIDVDSGFLSGQGYRISNSVNKRNHYDAETHVGEIHKTGKS